MSKDAWQGRHWLQPLAIVATAALCGLYARGDLGWPLGFVMLVPWLLALDATRRGRAVLASAVLMSVAFVAAVFGWFGAAIGAYIGIGTPAATLALLLLAPLLQAQFIVFALVRHRLGARHGALLRACAAAAAWVACEWLLGKLLGDTLGHGLHPSATLRQVADLGGAAGLTLLLLLVNEAVALAIRRRRQGLRAIATPLAAGLGVIVAMAAYGTARLHALPAALVDAGAPLRIGIVQASITDYEALREQHGTHAVVRHVLDTHFALSRAAVEHHGADALLWSETVYPTTFGQPRSEAGAAFDREILAFVDALGVPLVLGTYDVDAGGEYNVAAFVEPDRGLLGFYRKTHPFPFTEHVPAWLDGPRLRGWLPWTGHWQPGSGARVLPLRTADGREVDVLPLICLDDVRSQLAIDGARLGAQAILGLSNDSWFTAHPIGARLHLTVATFRSIETRLPQIRVTTNGMSAIVDETGEVLVHTGMGDVAVLAGEIPARLPPMTLMVRWGDWVGRAALWLLLALAGIGAWRRLQRRLAALDAAAASPPADDGVAALLLSPATRVAVAALQLVAAAGLAWLGLGMLIDGPQVNSVAQIRFFVAAVVAPTLAAWAIRRAAAGIVRIDAGTLRLQSRTQCIEIALADIVGLRGWRLPLPGFGLQIALASGRRLPLGLVLSHPQRLSQVLAAAGAPIAVVDAATTRAFALAELRAATPRRWFDHALIRLGLFPLLLALPAFRLHQYIAFGSTFGEVQLHGLQAWLLGLLVWWLAWVIGMSLLAALLRAVIEIGSALVLAFRPAAAIDVRRGLEWSGRLLYFVGTPTWVLLRILAG